MPQNVINQNPYQRPSKLFSRPLISLLRPPKLSEKLLKPSQRPKPFLRSLIMF